MDMVRTVINLDGDVLWQEEWTPLPVHKCFYCDIPLERVNRDDMCPRAQLGVHEWVDVAFR